jgi:hypothetical protein
MNSCAIADPVQAMMHRRGFEYISANPTSGLLIPRNADDDTVGVFYEAMKKYSFRLLLRNILRHRDSPFRTSDLLQYSTEQCVEDYAGSLVELGVLEPAGRGRFTLAYDDVRGFGETLEWFVANVFVREFGAPAHWTVKLRGTTSGGDCDVIVSMENEFLYGEVKSSPPKHVEQNEVSAFLDRCEDLQPDWAMFVEDTELRMKDKIVPMFEQEFSGRTPESAGKKIGVERLVNEVFHVDDRIYIVNSKRDLVTNIGRCVAHHLKSRGITFG